MDDENSMADPKNPQIPDEPLGMNRRILRRDFMNSTLLGSGGTLLGSLTPRQLLAKEEWTGYAGVGDYARSNGNTYEIVHAGHQIRDNVFAGSGERRPRPTRPSIAWWWAGASAGWRPRCSSSDATPN